MIKKVSVAEKLSQFSDHWSPKVIATVSGMDVKLAKVQGEFVWHAHEKEDELFFVLKGKLVIELRDGRVELGPGECVVIPKGVEHKPVADEEAHVMLFEAASIDHTGGVEDRRRVKEFQRI